jgi:hypothetical protein
MVLSLPFNVITLMRWMGWEWWTALLATVFIGLIPIVGQLAYVIFAIAGAYFFVNAGFSWQRAVHPTAAAFTMSELSASEFANYKTKVMQPETARLCKEEAKGYAIADGRLPVMITDYCECFARVAMTELTQDDARYAQAHGRRPADFEDRVRTAILKQCRR